MGPAHPAPTQEALILITAKKLDEDRLIKPTSTPQDPTVKGVLRWKWLVICCCSHGYLRSNDKWDNLLRDYKKACESESNAQSKGDPPLIGIYIGEAGSQASESALKYEKVLLNYVYNYAQSHTSTYILII